MSTVKRQESRKYLLAMALLVLAFFAELIVSMGGAPSRHATALAGSSEPAAAAPATASPGNVSPREANAELDAFELQLD